MKTVMIDDLEYVAIGPFPIDNTTDLEYFAGLLAQLQGWKVEAKRLQAELDKLRGGGE
jgi:hypothetical protein